MRFMNAASSQMNCSILAAATVIFVAIGTATAGTLYIPVDAGSSAAVAVTDGNSVQVFLVADTNGNGVLQVTIKNQDQVKGFGVCSVLDGKTDCSGGTFSAASSLKDVEPVAFPSFTHATGSSTLVTVVDLAQLHQSGNPFTTGTIIPVVAGATPLSSAITVRSGVGLSSDLSTAAQQIVSINFIQSLPLYTGNVSVSGETSALAATDIPTLNLDYS